MIRAGGVVVPGSPGLVLALGLSRFAGSELDDRVETSKCALCHLGSFALTRAVDPCRGPRTRRNTDVQRFWSCWL